MKKIIFLFSFLAAAAAVSCTEEERCGVVSVSEGELTTLRVGVSTTRADGENQTESEAKVNKLQVFVFTKDGALERSGFDNSGTSKSVEMTCFAGEKEVVAVVNAPEEINWLEVSTKRALDSLVTRLDENSGDDFFMYGSAEATISAYSSTSINVEVSRRVARVVLKSVTNDVEHNSVVGKLCLNEVYLINAPGEDMYVDYEGYVPSEWYNKSALDGEHTSPLYDFLYNSIGSEEVESNESYTTGHTFYCYPNPMVEDSNDSVWSPRLTRLVVEATLNGNRWYYPVTLEEVKANCSYEIDLIIEGAGSDSPDSEPRNTNYTFIVTVADWEEVPISAKI